MTTTHRRSRGISGDGPDAAQPRCCTLMSRFAMPTRWVYAIATISCWKKCRASASGTPCSCGEHCYRVSNMARTGGSPWRCVQDEKSEGCEPSKRLCKKAQAYLTVADSPRRKMRAHFMRRLTSAEVNQRGEVSRSAPRGRGTGPRAGSGRLRARTPWLWPSGVA